MGKILLSVFLAVFFSAPAFAGLTLSIFGGERYYLGNMHKPFNEQFTRGVRLDFGKNTWPVNIALDFYITNHNDLHYINNTLAELDTTLTEIRIGLRKYYGKGLRLLIGGGIENMEYVRKESSVSGSPKCSASTGYTLFKNGMWAEAGLDYAIGKFVVVGLKADYSNGYVSCGSRTVDLNAVNGGVYLGVSW
ncbi:MAG: hypothetical protein LBD73_08685 [Deferribacteraceae bacterium]|jgi:hypothetical protein|nr:hypothetical protein [Deferribacteraceae bacterium]